MKQCPYDKCLSLLKKFKKEHSSIPLSVHLATAFIEYEDISFLSDSKLFKLLQEYENKLDMDKEFDVEKIIEEGVNLTKILEDDEYGE